MTVNIYQFQNALRYGTARANQFRVIFPNITGSAGLVGQDSASRMTVLCKAASLPSSTIQDLELFYRGRKYHEAGEVDFQAWNCTFINDASFGVRGLLEAWSNQIQHRDDIGGETNVSNYKKDIIVQHLDRSGKILREYTLVGAYPTEIGQIDLSYDNNSQVEEFPCTFVYDYFTISRTGSTGLYESYREADEVV